MKWMRLCTSSGQVLKILRLAEQLSAFEEKLCVVRSVGCYFRKAAFGSIKCSWLLLPKLSIKFDKTQKRCFEPSLRRRDRNSYLSTCQILNTDHAQYGYINRANIKCIKITPNVLWFMDVILLHRGRQNVSATHTYLLTPWCRVLLEKLTGLQLVKKFPAFYGTRRFITVLTSVRHLSSPHTHIPPPGDPS